MPNTSATGGILTQTAGPTEGQTLLRFLHAVVSGVSGLGATEVRPMWQQNPPPIPGIETDWCGYGITDRRADANSYHKQLDLGGAELIRHEEFDVLCSFYGPACLDYAGRLRDGMQLAQNRENLFIAGMGLVGFSDIIHVPELVNERFFDRADITMTLRREIKRSYDILHFVAVDGIVVTETLSMNWSA